MNKRRLVQLGQKKQNGKLPFATRGCDKCYDRGFTWSNHAVKTIIACKCVRWLTPEEYEKLEP